MPKKRTTRIYQRNGRYYADFRDFADVGGKQEALAPDPLTRRATDDPDVAQKLCADRLKELQELRLSGHKTGVQKVATLFDFAAEHLREKAQHEDITDSWLEHSQKRLEDAVAYFGADRTLTSIRPSDVKGWQKWLRKTKKGKGGKQLSDGTIRHYLNTLSGLYGTAQENEVVPLGYNPVAVLKNKPRGRPGEPKWFEVHEAALILEAAKLYKPKREDIAHRFLYPLVATYLITGGRRKEILGLEVEDVSFDRRTITFRSNEWRGLKTEKSERVIPLWPQLRTILQKYLTDFPPQTLLFPVTVNGREQMAWDIEKQLDALAKRLKMPPASIRSQMLRNTYCAARLQTLDNKQPVSIFTVAREMGHGSTAMVQRIYGHLGTVRHRSKSVEYRVSHFKKELGERLAALRAAGSR